MLGRLALVEGGTGAFLREHLSQGGYSRRSLVRPSRKGEPLILWLLIGLTMIATVGVPDVRRTQEARVLVTARQMLGSDVQGWLIPHLNGEPRLQKPPLGYWLAAGSYALFGTSVWAGRLPFAVVAWLTGALVYRFGRELFGLRAGVVAMVATLGCLMVANYGRLAETDALATAFVTLGVYAHWRAMSLGDRGGVGRWRRIAWFHLGALAAALAVLSKGPPGAFPFLFLMALPIVTGHWRGLVHWLTSGAALTFCVVAAPWFMYVAASGEYQTLLHEVKVVTAGGGHRGSFLVYIPYLLMGALPWTGLTVLGLWAMLPRLRRNRRLGAVALWIVVIFVPLCLVGQKQRHYLVLLMPPLMLLTGWCADRAARSIRSSVMFRAGWGVIWVTGVGLAIAGLTVPILAAANGSLGWDDLLVAAALLLSAAAVLRHTFTRDMGASLSGLVLTAAPAIILVHNLWLSDLEPATPETIATAIRGQAGGGTVRFYGAVSLPLQFHLGNDEPPLRSPDTWLALLSQEPEAIVIRLPSAPQSPPVPEGALPAAVLYDNDDDPVEIYANHWE